VKQLTNESGLSQPDAERAQEVIQEALASVRKHLGMEVAYLSEFVDGQSVFRSVDAPGLEHLIKAGDMRALDEVYCNHILAGRLPELIPDTAAEPIAMGMAITAAVPIGSHVSVPILRADGTPYGMFCCLSSRPNPTLNARDLETMKMFAALAARNVNAELDKEQTARLKARRIRAVMAGDGFTMMFQPIFDIGKPLPVAYEALCRFAPQPYRSPDQWFNDAIEVGLGVDLELAAIAAAMAAFETLPAHAGLSVNASPETVASGRLMEALDPRFLHRTTLEVTEHARVEDYVALRRELTPLQGLGLTLAVDDAGAGYSGLKHIVQLAPDIIKLDMSLTRGIDTDPALRALASAMVFYARETGSTVVAEGIETAEEMSTLQMLGVNRGQGYFLGKPQPLGALAGNDALRA
jgi:EAL domain-containing protein (putative c-di-GMP-specific phosphodiesterase class I)